jgi:hypothetical protein
LRFSQLAPLPTASDALGFLQPNQPNPGLTGLLAAYDADVLVLVRGDQWSIWGLPFRVGGQLPLNRRILLPDVLAETLAMAAQWPMARGRNVISVYGAINLADFAGVQTALRGLPEVNQLQLLQTSADHLLFAVANPLTIAFDAALTVDAHFADMSRSNILPASVWEARRLAGLMRAKLWQMPIDLPAAAPSPNSIN